MRKILLAVVLLFFTTGCYDYIELNDLSIISGIGIDKENDNYKVTYEILNDQKSESSNEKAVIIEGTGATISEAFDNANQEVPKLAFYPHLKVVVISEMIAEEKMYDIVDYILRSPRIRNEFYLVVAKDIKANEIFTNASEDIKVASTQIETMLKNNPRRKNNASPYTFEEIAAEFLDKRVDAAITSITLKDKQISIEGLAIFDEYKLKGILSSEASYAYNILKSNAKNIQYTFSCGKDENITLSIYDASPSVIINQKKELEIKIDAKASIVEYNCNKSLKEPQTYDYLNNYYNTKINNHIENFYREISEKKTDILGISNIYFKSHRKDIEWTSLDYKISTNLKINNAGLIFEVNK